MTTLAIIGLASGVLAIAGGPPYFTDILKGKTKPERATWLVWTIQGFIALISQALLGAHWSLVFVGLNAVGNLAVLLLSIKFGVGGWKFVDKLALLIALAGLAISLVTKAPFIALLGVIIADFAGTVPTFFKVYRMPESETTFTWLTFGSASLLAMFATGSWRWSLIAYPLYLTLDNFAVILFQLLGRANASKAVSKGRSSKRLSTKSSRRQLARQSAD